MNMKVLVLVCITLPFLTNCERTTCERWYENTAIRCRKDNYVGDTIFIRNIANTEVAFDVLKGMSYCKKSGVVYANKTYKIAASATMELDFCEADAGICNELFVDKCKQGTNTVHCIDVLVVFPTIKNTC